MFVKNVMRIFYLEMLLIYKVHVVHDSFMGDMIQALLDICISCIHGHLQNCEFIGSQSLEGSGLTVERYFTCNPTLTHPTPPHPRRDTFAHDTLAAYHVYT